MYIVKSPIICPCKIKIEKGLIAERYKNNPGAKSGREVDKKMESKVTKKIRVKVGRDRVKKK